MKKIAGYIVILALALTMLWAPVDKVHAADLAMSLSASQVKIGDTVVVSITVPAGCTAQISVTYPADLLTYVSSSVTSNDIGGVTGLVIGTNGSSATATTTGTITYKAKAVGNATISATADGFNVEGDPVQIGGASKSVSIVNETLSDDNSLSTLKLSSGTLSPAFKYNVTNYTATVDYHVTRVDITAKTSNEKATIESVTGNEDLKVGENTIAIVVKAESGAKATYKIIVTRLEQSTGGNEGGEGGEGGGEQGDEPLEPEKPGVEFSYSGQQFVSKNEIPETIIPQDFNLTTQVISGQEINVLSHSKGTLTLICLVNENGGESLYVYDDVEEDIYPFIKLEAEKSYVIVLRPAIDVMLEGYSQCTLSIEGKGAVIAFQKTKQEETKESKNFLEKLFAPMVCYAAEPREEEFYLVYCLNNNGEYGWYLYDSVDGTFQRYLEHVNDISKPETDEITDDEAADLAAMNVELKNELERQQWMIYGLAGAGAILLVALIVVTILGMRNSRVTEEDNDDFLEKLAAEKTSQIVQHEVKDVENAPELDSAEKSGSDTENDLVQEEKVTEEVMPEDDFDVDISMNDIFPDEDFDYDFDDLEIEESDEE